jgi:RNA ligase (TIGR02306 family)
MSFFGVTLEQIGRIDPIEGADRIECATLRGKDFRFVIGRGSFAPGDACLYIPVDSLLPPALAEALGVAGKLAGKARNRVKTVKLRGQISQGIVAPRSIVPEEVLAAGPEAITAHLGIVKYEPPEIVSQDAILTDLPDGVSVYDIEGADRYTEVASLLEQEEVLVTEKLEGSNFSVLVRPDGTVCVNQHRKTVLPKEGAEHTFWKVARRARVIGFAQSLAALHPGLPVLVYGEVLGPGIQGNHYRLKEHEVRLFDVRIGGAWVDPRRFLHLVGEFYGEVNEMTVPVLHLGPLAHWLGGHGIKHVADGRSRLADVRREGVVIRPCRERDLPGFGRLILKQRGPEYLAGSDA